MEDEIIFIKRVNGCTGMRTFHKPVIKMELKHGRFIISDVLAKILNVDNDNGLMFGFNKKAQTGYVVRDDEMDAFILKRKDKNSLRFSSKNLVEHFQNTFDLAEEKTTFHFYVSEKPNDKGLFTFNNI